MRGDCSTPCFVALDGRSGSGKSTLAACVAAMLDAAPASGAERDGDRGRPVLRRWDGPSGGTSERRTSAPSQVIDWRRQRAVLQALRTTGRAEWHPFDWDAPDWDTDIVPLRTESLHCTVSPVVVLEGAYSAVAELHDLLDMRVLLDTPTEVRLRRLLRAGG